VRTLPHTRSCFVCGESNAIGLNLRFKTDGQAVHGRFVPRPEHIGFKGIVHGGIITTVLDEVMVWACVVQAKRFAFCAELTVRFLNPVRPGQTLLVTAELAANRRDKIFEAKAEMRDDAGLALATATGKYLPIKETDAAEMATEFVDDPRWLLESRATMQ
jgi:acyl-coenzyme A thioesterase PaaI-like protein